MKWMLFCEASADFETASGLVDRVLKERGPAWIAETLEAASSGLYEWKRDEGQARLWWDLHHIVRYARERGVKLPPGRFDGKAGKAGAAMARNVFTLVRALAKSDEIEALLLVWDADTQEKERKEGLDQARALEGWSFVRVVALATRSREAWVLAGFEPERDEDHNAIGRLRQEVGYSPVEQPHRLDSKDRSKKVLDELTQDDWNRQERCWQEPPLERLVAAGGGSGLADFLEQVERKLLPLVSAGQRGA